MATILLLLILFLVIASLLMDWFFPEVPSDFAQGAGGGQHVERLTQHAVSDIAAQRRRAEQRMRRTAQHLSQRYRDTG